MCVYIYNIYLYMYTHTHTHTHTHTLANAHMRTHIQQLLPEMIGECTRLTSLSLNNNKLSVVPVI